MRNNTTRPVFKKSQFYIEFNWFGFRVVLLLDQLA